MEEWKQIDRYPNYWVSTYGRVYSVKRGIILKPFHDSWGYLNVVLRNENGGHTTKVARLVALAFIPNPCNKEQVNHIDGDKENNHVENLEWATCSENIRHAVATGLNDHSSYNAGKQKKRVRDADTGVVFESISECARKLGCTDKNVIGYFRRNGRYCVGHRLELLD